MRALSEEPASEAYPKLVCPTLIIPVGPAALQTGSERALAVKNSRVHWIPETFHASGYHKAKGLARAIREFLDESSQSLA